MKVVISPGYLLMKFPTLRGVGQVRSNQKQGRVCYMSSTKTQRGKETLMINEQKLEANKPQPVESLEAIPLSHNDEN